MTNRKLISAIFLLAIFYIAYWVADPFSLNPFSVTPVSLANIEEHFECEQSEEFDSRSSNFINSAITSNDFLGVSAGVYAEKCGTWLSTAGYLSKNSKEIPNALSLFRIASISKPMTAVAILKLYEKGKIDLDIPIQTYLPEFPIKEQGQITIRQLLQHRSGIPHYRTNLGIFNFSNYESSEQALVKFSHRKLAFKPGTSFLYSSYGYTLLGAIIEKVSGKSYQEYMKENVWGPAGMSRTDIEKSNVEYDNKSGLFIKVGNTFIRSPKNDLSYTYSGGGIQSTAEDLLKFGEAILQYKLISPSTTRMMMQGSDIANSSKEYTYGWDTWISSEHGKTVEHNGTQVGASSFLRIYFDKKIVVVTLSNSLNSSEEARSLSIKLVNGVLDTK